ncbi:hypothetical protein ACO0RG_002781 [Hanseniaspora osmophila]
MSEIRKQLEARDAAQKSLVNNEVTYRNPNILPNNVGGSPQHNPLDNKASLLRPSEQRKYNNTSFEFKAKLEDQLQALEKKTQAKIKSDLRKKYGESAVSEQ